MKGPLDVSSPAPCLKHSQLEHVAQGLVHLSFEYLERWWCQTSSGNVFPYLSTLIVRKNTFLHLVGISHVPTCVRCLSFYHCSSPRSVWLSSLTHPLSGCIRWDLSLAFSLPSVKKPSSLSFSLYVLCSSLLTSFVAFHWNCCSALLVMGSTKVDAVFQIWSHKRWIERNNNFPRCAGYMLADSCRQQDSLKSGYFTGWGAVADDYDDLEKMLWSGLTVPSASSFSAFRCILSGSMDLRMSNWLKFLLTWSSSTVGNALFPHTLLEDPGTWQAWRQTLSVRKGKKGVEYISPKVQRASFVTRLPALLNSKPMFSLTFLFLPVYLKKPFFTFLTSFNSSWALAFLTVPACLGCVSIPLLASPSSLPPLHTFSFVFELSQHWVDLIICAGLLSCLLYFLLVRIDCSSTLRKLTLKIRQHTWAPLGGQGSPSWDPAKTFLE